MLAAADIDPILDAIDWDAPTSLPTEDRHRPSTADANPALYEFIAAAAELIADPDDWRRFADAFNRYDQSRGRR
jgi:hypothetical protein